MKIAFVTTDNREHNMKYDLAEPYFGTAPEALLQGFAAMPGLTVHVISFARKVMKSPEKLAENIWFHSLHVPKLGWMQTLYSGCILAARRKIRDLQLDIAHGQGTERACAISAVFSGLPSVVTIHGNMRLIAKVNRERPFSFNWLAARLETFTLPRTRGVVCITRYTRDAVKDLAPKTWVVPNAVDCSFFDLQSQPEDSRLILCVGMICHRKNQNNFIRALDSLSGTVRFKLVFLGEGREETPYGREFEELVKARPWCEYAGFAGRDELKAWLQRANALALPSLEDNCPMVVLEAMAAGVPVLAANVGGVPDLIESGKTGLLCDPLDPASLRDSVSRMLGDAELRQHLAGTARQLALERYHPRAIAQRHLEIYREVLSPNGQKALPS